MTDETKDLAPLAAAGAVTEAEREALRRAANEDPTLAEEILFWKRVSTAAAPAASEPSPGEAGWRRLTAALDQDQPAAAEPTGQVVDLSTRRRRRRRADAFWPVVAMAACLALAVQTTFVLTQPGAVAPEGALSPAGDAASAAQLVVTFRPDASERDIRELLLEVDGEIVAGPSAIGVYRLGFATDDARDLAEAALAARSEIVETVSD